MLRGAGESCSCQNEILHSRTNTARRPPSSVPPSTPPVSRSRGPRRAAAPPLGLGRTRQGREPLTETTCPQSKAKTQKRECWTLEAYENSGVCDPDADTCGEFTQYSLGCSRRATSYSGVGGTLRRSPSEHQYQSSGLSVNDSPVPTCLEDLVPRVPGAGMTESLAPWVPEAEMTGSSPVLRVPGTRS